MPLEEIRSFPPAADVVVVPQRDTPDTRGQVPAKLFDAMALGRPIVSTRVSMIPEILEGCGLLVEAGDVSALGAAIAPPLDHPGEAAAPPRPAPDPSGDGRSVGAPRPRPLPPCAHETSGYPW